MNLEEFKGPFDRLVEAYNRFGSKALYDAYYVVVNQLTAEEFTAVALQVLKDPEVKELPKPAELVQLAMNRRRAAVEVAGLLEAPKMTPEEIHRAIESVEQKAKELIAERPVMEPKRIARPQPVALREAEWNERVERLRRQA